MATCRCCICSTTVLLALCLIEILLGIIVLLLGILNVFTSHGLFQFELKFGYIDLWAGPLVVLAGILYGCYLISHSHNHNNRDVQRSCCWVIQWLRCYLCFVLFVSIAELIFAYFVVIKYKEAKLKKTEYRFVSQYRTNVPACFKEDCELRITLGYGFIIFACLQIVVTICLLTFRLQTDAEVTSEDSDKTPESKVTVIEDARVNGKIVFRSPRLNRYVYGREHPRHYYNMDRKEDMDEKDSLVEDEKDSNHTDQLNGTDSNGQWQPAHNSVCPPLANLEDMELGMSDVESPDEEPLPPPPSTSYYQYTEPEEEIWVPRKLTAYIV